MIKNYNTSYFVVLQLYFCW